MSWVERGGRLYEYRSVRRGGRVTSEYLGRPFDNDLATMMADLESNVREIERLEVAELRKIETGGPNGQACRAGDG